MTAAAGVCQALRHDAGSTSTRTPCASDGTNTITENVALALERELAGIAITDHDTTAGYAEAAAAAEGTGLLIVPGIEFSAEYEGASLHVLAYWADPADPALVEELRRLTDTRFRRGELMVEKLQALGYDISFDAGARDRGRRPDRPAARRAGDGRSGHRGDREGGLRPVHLRRRDRLRARSTRSTRWTRCG